MMNPPVLSAEALERFQRVVKHLGAVNMLPRVAPSPLPDPDPDSLGLTKRIAAYALDKQSRT